MTKLRLDAELTWFERGSTDTSAGDWMFGAAKHGIPPLFGYALGYDLVGKYRAAHAGLPWNELIKIESSAFVS